MGFIRPVEEARLFTALLSKDERLFQIAREKLSSSLSTVDFVSPVYPWAHTRYYEKEMGTDLKRVFLFFEQPVQPDILPYVKKMTNELEVYFRANSGETMPARPMNIDPGYLTLAKVVLAATKDYYHRIYIGEGIYAEVTLYYRDKTYQPFLHTYPDYRSQEYISIFNEARERMLGQ